MKLLLRTTTYNHEKNYKFNDCIKTVKLRHSFDFSHTLALNYFQNGNSCFP